MNMFSKSRIARSFSSLIVNDTVTDNTGVAVPAKCKTLLQDRVLVTVKTVY